MHDLELVFGHAPVVTTEKDKLNSHVILYGTVGHSPILDELDKKNLIDLKEIEGKREVFLFQVIDQPIEGTEKALVIAGSDKRGTIYGLFHLSEKLGVISFVEWNGVRPKQK